MAFGKYERDKDFNCSDLKVRHLPLTYLNFLSFPRHGPLLVYDSLQSVSNSSASSAPQSCILSDNFCVSAQWSQHYLNSPREPYRTDELSPWLQFKIDGSSFRSCCRFLSPNPSHPSLLRFLVLLQRSATAACQEENLKSTICFSFVPRWSEKDCLHVPLRVREIARASGL
jgi:hypothetical protein